jgi:hypothetical protein
MHASRPFLGLWVCGLAACGGGSSKPMLIDAAVPDTAVVCSQKGSVGLNPLDFSKGAGQAQGAVPPNGGTELTVSVVVTLGPTPTTTTPSFGLLITQVNNAGVFGTAEAGRFEKPPVPGTYPMDTDMAAGFRIDFVDGVTLNPTGGVNINPMQVALLDSTAGGTVKIDSWTPAATPSGTSTIGATFTNAKFKGFNVLSNGNLDQGNGCDVMLTSFQFTNLSVKWQPGAFPTSFAPPVPAPPSFGPRTLDGAALIQADRLQSESP